jgi:hypothetical protein
VGGWVGGWAGGWGLSCRGVKGNETKGFIKTKSLKGVVRVYEAYEVKTGGGGITLSFTSPEFF